MHPTSPSQAARCAATITRHLAGATAPVPGRTSLVLSCRLSYLALESSKPPTAFVLSDLRRLLDELFHAMESALFCSRHAGTGGMVLWCRTSTRGRKGRGAQQCGRSCGTVCSEGGSARMAPRPSSKRLPSSTASTSMAILWPNLPLVITATTTSTVIHSYKPDPSCAVTGCLLIKHSQAS